MGRIRGGDLRYIDALGLRWQCQGVLLKFRRDRGSISTFSESVFDVVWVDRLFQRMVVVCVQDVVRGEKVSVGSQESVY